VIEVRKSNLRVCSPSQNGCNKKKQSNNKSGVTGVFWLKSIKRWWAYADINKRRFTAGYFENLEDAVTARNELAARLHGEFFVHQRLA
jgi:hypothetical protein